MTVDLNTAGPGFSFDPTYGYDLAALRRVEAPPEPVGFAEFWRATFSETMATPLQLESRASEPPLAAYHVTQVSFASLGGFRVRAWVTRPKEGPIERGLVVSHGYGGRSGPDAWLPVEKALAIFPCARGLALSAQAGLPTTAMQHVLHGIESTSTYILRGCAADVWASASAALSLAPEIVGKIDYVGGSFGGGLGALALPWDGRFRRAHLGVPSFGHQPLRLLLPSIGSAEAVRRLAQRQPKVAQVLAYFDAAVAARHLRIPTQVVAALRDPAVPPPGQFAVYNALAGRKELIVVTAAHLAHAEEAAETAQVREALRGFLA